MTNAKTITLTLFLYLNSFKIVFRLKILSWIQDVFLVLGKFPSPMATEQRAKYVWLVWDLINSITNSYNIQFVNNSHCWRHEHVWRSNGFPIQTCIKAEIYYLNLIIKELAWRSLIKLVRQYPYILLFYYNYTMKTPDYCWITNKRQ